MARKRAIKTRVRAITKYGQGPSIDEIREARQLAHHSKLREFLAPTRQKRAYLLALSLFLGVAFGFVHIGALLHEEAIYWAAYVGLIALSFPSFLLWQGYGTESFSGFGPAFYIFAIALQGFWLHLISCSLSIFIKWKKVGK
ncbi:MAG: hypothetical protein ABH863_04415 [Candidatus Micrarchaeota archaeon]